MTAATPAWPHAVGSPRERGCRQRRPLPLTDGRSSQSRREWACRGEQRSYLEVPDLAPKMPQPSEDSEYPQGTSPTRFNPTGNGSKLREEDTVASLRESAKQDSLSLSLHTARDPLQKPDFSHAPRRPTHFSSSPVGSAAVCLALQEYREARIIHLLGQKTAEQATSVGFCIPLSPLRKSLIRMKK